MNTTKINPKTLSKEEIHEASQKSLVDFLSSIGEPLKRKGNQVFWTGGGNDSVAIVPYQPNLYKHFATGESGNAIQFCRSYLRMSFAEAVETLNGGRLYTTYQENNKSHQKPLDDHKIHEKKRAICCSYKRQ